MISQDDIFKADIRVSPKKPILGSSHAPNPHDRKIDPKSASPDITIQTPWHPNPDEEASDFSDSFESYLSVDAIDAATPNPHDQITGTESASIDVTIQTSWHPNPDRNSLNASNRLENYLSVEANESTAPTPNDLLIETAPKSTGQTLQKSSPQMPEGNLPDLANRVEGKLSTDGVEATSAENQPHKNNKMAAPVNITENKPVGVNMPMPIRGSTLVNAPEIDAGISLAPMTKTSPLISESPESIAPSNILMTSESDASDSQHPKLAPSPAGNRIMPDLPQTENNLDAAIKIRDIPQEHALPQSSDERSSGTDNTSITPKGDALLPEATKSSIHPLQTVDQTITVAAKHELEPNTKTPTNIEDIRTNAAIRTDDGIPNPKELRSLEAPPKETIKLASEEPMKLASLFDTKNIVMAASSTLSSTSESPIFALSAYTPSPLSIAAPQMLSPLSPGLNAPSFTSVINSIVRTVETQKGVSVRLDPPEMGRVYIDYQFEADRSVTAVVRADLPEALAQLRDNTAFLQNLLKESGFDQVNLSFEQNSSDKDAPNPEDFEAIRASRDSEASLQAHIPLAKDKAAPRFQGATLNQSIDIKL